MTNVTWPEAYPDWEDYTPEAQREHREECPDLCSLCEDHRAFGTCTSCEAWPVEVDHLGESNCCGSPVALDPCYRDLQIAA